MASLTPQPQGAPNPHGLMRTFSSVSGRQLQINASQSKLTSRSLNLSRSSSKVSAALLEHVTLFPPENPGVTSSSTVSFTVPLIHSLLPHPSARGHWTAPLDVLSTFFPSLTLFPQITTVFPAILFFQNSPFKVMYLLLFSKWITNKEALLYSMWSSTQFYVSAWMGGGFGGEWIYVYVWLSPFTVHLKLPQHSVQFSRSVVSDSLRPHEPQHARPPCPSPTPRVQQIHVH